MRVAGAPISWGVCEVPGWGYQFDASDGAGPDGRGRPGRHRVRPRRLPARRPRRPRRDAARRARARRPSGSSSRSCCTTRATTRCPRSSGPWTASSRRGASTVVLAAATGQEGYDDRPVLDDAGWADPAGQPRPARARLPPRAASPPPCTRTSAPWSSRARRPTGCSPAAASGSASTPATCSSAAATRCAVAREHPDRIAHVHLKDVRLDWARRVQSGEATYTEAVRGGMYVPLGRGRRRHRRHRRRPGGRRVRRVVRPRAGHHPHGRPRREAGADGPGDVDVRTSLLLPARPSPRSAPAWGSDG